MGNSKYIKFVLEYLSSKIRKNIYFSISLIVIESITEVAFVALVLPIILLFTQIGPAGGRIGSIFIGLGVETRDEQLVICGILLLTIGICRFLVKSFSQLFRENITFDVRTELAQRIYQNYLNISYTELLKLDSTKIVSSITTESVIVSSLVQDLLSIIFGIVTFLMMFALMTIIDPILTILALTICVGIGTLSYIALYNRKKVLGQKMYDARQNMSAIAMQSFLSFRETVVYSQQMTFLEKFGIYSEKMRKAFYQGAIYKIVPGSFIENGFVVIIALVILLNGVGISMEAGVTARITALAIIMMRLLPIISQLATQFSQLSFHEASLNDTKQALAMYYKNSIYKNQKNYSKIKGPIKSISIEDLNYTYEGDTRPTLSNITFNLKPRTLTGIFGQSGSGKSTLINCILGFLEPNSGAINFNDVSIFKNLANWHSRIGFVPQEPHILNDTIKSNIIFGRKRIDESERLINVIEQVQLNDVISLLPFGIDTNIGERGLSLSGGQRQRLALARALYDEPELLILDEATSSLDNSIAAAVDFAISALKSKLTILIIAHRISTMSRCDSVIVINNGTIEEIGPPEIVMKSNMTFKKLIDADKLSIK